MNSNGDYEMIIYGANKATPFIISCAKCGGHGVVFEPKIYMSNGHQYSYVDADFPTKLPNGWRCFIVSYNHVDSQEIYQNEVSSINASNCFCSKCSEEIEILQILQ